MAGQTDAHYGQRNTRRSEGIRAQLGGGDDAAASARRHLGRLRSDLDPPLMENVRLLVTELVTNAVRHSAASIIDLTVLVAPSRVHVEVANPGGAFEPRPSGPEDGGTGWGLFLIDRLSDDWGVVDDADGGYQRVWFEVARS